MIVIAIATRVIIDRLLQTKKSHRVFVVVIALAMALAMAMAMMAD